MLTKDLLDQIVVVIAINEMRLVQPNRQPQVRLRVVKQESRAVAGNPRDAAVIFDP